MCPASYCPTPCGKRSGVRVISLVPSATETLAAWGVEPVAVTRFCERPDLPAVGGTKNPDIAAIVALAPDVVVMNTEENRKEDAEALRKAEVKVHVIAIDRVEDVLSQMAHLATVCGLAELPAPLADWEPRPAALRVRAFVPIWRRPWMTVSANTYGASILRAAGIEVVGATTGSERYPEVDLASVAALRPDVVLAPTEPYAFTERHRAELETVAPVEFVDGKDIFWWGVRTPGATTRLRELAQRLDQTLRR